jgi:hypothetical protein
LPTSLSDAARKPYDNCDHVAERREGNEEVQSTHSTAVAEDFVEEQSGCSKVGVLQLVFGDCDVVRLGLFAFELRSEDAPAAKNATLANM